MKLNILLLLGLATIQAEKTVIIGIDDTAISSIASSSAQWVQAESQTAAAQKIAKELSIRHEKAHLRILQAQKKILKPILKDIKSFIKHVEVDSSCDVDTCAECIVSTVDKDACMEKTGCQVEMTKLSIEKQQKLLKKWNTNFYDAAIAFRKLSKDLKKDQEVAQLKMQNEVFKVAQDFAEGSAPMWKEAGCEPTCVDNCVADIKSYLNHGCSQCSCKELVKVA